MREPTALFKLPELVSWLETKPADLKVNYTRCSTCMIAQFLQHQGLDVISGGPWTAYYRTLTGERVGAEIPRSWETIAGGDTFSPDEENTFGACLERARVELKKETDRGCVGRAEVQHGLEVQS